MNNKSGLLVLSLFSSALVLGACSKKDDASTSPAAGTAVQTAIATVNAKAAASAKINSSNTALMMESVGDVEVQSSGDVHTFAANALDAGTPAYWTDTSIYPALSNSGNEDAHHHINNFMTSSFKNNNGAYVQPFGRLKNALAMPCLFDSAVTTRNADGTPAAGTYTLNTDNMDFSSASVCGMSGDTKPSPAFTGTITVSVPTSTTLYDVKYVINIDTYSGGGGGGLAFTLYYGNKSGVIHLLSIGDERYEPHGGNDSAELVVATYDSVNQVGKFEYVESGFGSGNLEFFRIWADFANGLGGVYGQYSTSSSSDNMTVVGNPNGSANVAVSMCYNGSAATCASGSTYQGCIDTNFASIVTGHESDITTGCFSGHAGIQADTTTSTAANWFRSNRLTAGRTTTTAAWDDPTKTVTFTDLSDIHTAHSN